ncbi:unnamed protein product, partial [Oppiella nova]
MSGQKPRSRSRSKPAALDGSDLYAAEAILDKKTNAEGKTLYYIKWLGWPHHSNTWEPEENIASDSLVQEFEERVQTGETYKQMKRRRSLEEKNAQYVAASGSQASTHKSLKKGAENHHKKAKHHKHESHHRKADTGADHRSHKADPSLINFNTLVDRLKVTEREAKDAKKSGRQSSRSPSVNAGSRRSSRQPSRRNSLIADDQTVGDEDMRGMPDPHHILTRRVSSDSEHSVHSLVAKKPNSYYSDFDTQSSLESSPGVAIDGKPVNSEREVQTYLNSGAYEPQVVLERLPKLVLKRMLSNSYKPSYEVSIKTPHNNDDNDNDISIAVTDSKGCAEEVISDELSVDKNNGVNSEVLAKSDLNNNDTSAESVLQCHDVNARKIDDKVVITASGIDSTDTDIATVQSKDPEVVPEVIVEIPVPSPESRRSPHPQTVRDGGLEAIVAPNSGSSDAGVDLSQHTSLSTVTIGGEVVSEEVVTEEVAEEVVTEEMASEEQTALKSIVIALDGSTGEDSGVEVPVVESIDHQMITTDEQTAEEVVDTTDENPIKEPLVEEEEVIVAGDCLEIEANDDSETATTAQELAQEVCDKSADIDTNSGDSAQEIVVVVVD